MGPAGFDYLRCLTIAVYVDGIASVFGISILIDGYDMTNEILCNTGIAMCLAFFVGQKVFLYLFLVQRSHLIRGGDILRDWYNLAGLAIVALGFGTIGCLTFVYPVASMSPIDGKCRIGLPNKVTIPLLIYDIMINSLVTGDFVRLVNRNVRGPMSSAVRHALPRVLGRQRVQVQLDMLEIIVTKSPLGCCAIIIPTLANLVVLIKLHGREQGWICFTICTANGKSVLRFHVHAHLLTGHSLVGCAPVHRLTSNPMECKEIPLQRSTQAEAYEMHVRSGPVDGGEGSDPGGRP
ncbi:hypothetical protein MMC09_002781 [Bachmanniomyces sp. S44760]|nr:hypothetical protein [Bachmanniomyces sp. S44760]